MTQNVLRPNRAKGNKLKMAKGAIGHAGPVTIWGHIGHGRHVTSDKVRLGHAIEGL